MNIKASEFASIERVWKKGDKIDIRFTISSKILDGGISYPCSFGYTQNLQPLVTICNRHLLSRDL